MYDGEWANNQAEGYGKLILKEGDYFEGNFHADKIEGFFTNYPYNFREKTYFYL